MALITKPNTFTQGATIVAAEHNSNDDTIYNAFNGNISNANISGSAAIVDTKLAQITTASKVSTTAITGNLGGGQGGVPVGAVLVWSTATAPTGYTLCDGSAISRTTFADLFAVVSTTFGIGDGSTTFNVPDMRGRLPVGKDNLGGSSANRVTDTEADTIGSSEGAEDTTLTTAQLPGHTHTFGVFDNDTAGGRAADASGSQTGTETTSSTGSGNAHNNMNPYLTMGYIIKT